MTTAVSARVLPRVQESSQPSPSPLWDIWLGLRRSPSGMIGLIIVTVHICLALAAPTIVPYDPVEFDTSAIRAAPSAEHLFGTDKLGRDVLTRTLLGGRIALLVTMIGTGLAITWGGLLGITLAYLGGITDELVMRMLLSFSARAPFWGLASSRPRRIGA